MSLHKQFGTDKKAEVDGVWFSYPQPDGSTVDLKLARAGGANTPYQRELRRILRMFARAGDIPIEQFPPARDEVCEAMATHILKGWRTRQANGDTIDKIEHADGELRSYTPELAKELLLGLPDLRNDIYTKATDYRNFQDLDVEELEGNSSPASNGASGSASKTRKPAAE